MKEANYKQLKSTVTNFDRKYTKVVPLSKIKYDKKNSQVRSSGHVISKVPSYAETMRQHGPKAFPPTSVKQLPNGDYKLIDGNTRALAADEAKKDLFISWYHDAVLNPTPSEWDDLQLDFNDHPKSSPNSSQDIKDYLCRQQASGAMTLKVGYLYENNEENYIKAAVDVYRKKLPNTGKSKDWWRRAIENSLKGNIGIRYEIYTKSDLFEMYRTLHGFAGGKVGEISGGEAVFPFVDLSHLNPNVMGFIATKEMDNPNTNYTLIYSAGSMAGKDDKKLKKERQKVLDWVTKVQKHYSWSISVYFAPQIKCGPNQENMYQLRTTV